MEDDGPTETVTLAYSVKKHNDYFDVRIAGLNEEFHIHENNLDEYALFYDFIFDKIKEDYEKGLQKFLDQEDGTRKIGFQA